MDNSTIALTSETVQWTRGGGGGGGGGVKSTGPEFGSTRNYKQTAMFLCFCTGKLDQSTCSFVVQIMSLSFEYHGIITGGTGMYQFH